MSTSWLLHQGLPPLKYDTFLYSASCSAAPVLAGQELAMLTKHTRETAQEERPWVASPAAGFGLLGFCHLRNLASWYDLLHFCCGTVCWLFARTMAQGPSRHTDKQRGRPDQGTNLVAAAKPLFTPGSAKWSCRLAIGPCARARGIRAYIRVSIKLRVRVGCRT